MAWYNGKKEKEVPEVAPATVLESIEELTNTLAHFELKRANAFEALSGDKVKTEKQLNEKIANLRETLAQLKLTTKIEEEDLAHMIKMKEDRLQLEYDQKLMTEKQTHQDAIAELKEKHNGEIKEMQTAAQEQLKEMYSEILERLPNLNASLKIKSGNS